MIFTSMRARLLMATLLPIVLVVFSIVAWFWHAARSDGNAAHIERSKLLAQQLAVSSEYELFSGNNEHLLDIVQLIKRQPDVLSVAVFDRWGAPLAQVGNSAYTQYSDVSSPQFIQDHPHHGLDVVVEDIVAKDVRVNDLFSAETAVPAKQPRTIGHVVIEVSRERLSARDSEAIRNAVLLALVGLVFGGLMSERLGQRVVRPTSRVLQRVARIGQGDFSADPEVDEADPLHQLQGGLNRMAVLLASGRDELENRVSVATAELRVKKEEAETATLAKSQFLAAASHDLRQPTHALGLFIARLRQIPLDDQVGPLVGNIAASVQSLQNLMDGLLDLSRLDAGAVQTNIKHIHVDALFDSLRVTLEPMALQKGIRLQVRPTMLCVMSDATLLQRMIMNLVHNALRYTQHGTVLLACRPAQGGACVRIEVWDSGIGISQSNQSEIFKEFYQVGSEGRDNEQGMGLGLNIVERSARLLGHRIHLRSAVGCGSRFSITVPRAAVPKAPRPAMAVAQQQPDPTGLKLLVVENDAFSRQAMEALLIAWGCTVHAVTTRTEAMALIADQFLPDGIVCDYRLGQGDDGLNAIAQLRHALGRDVPACLISGDTDGPLMQSAKAAGLTLLHKPMRPERLMELLRQWSNDRYAPPTHFAD